MLAKAARLISTKDATAFDNIADKARAVPDCFLASTEYRLTTEVGGGRMKARGNEPTLMAAETLEDFEAFGSVCRAYVEWCRERYQDMPWFVEEVFGYQALEEELKGLAQNYGQPAGRTMLVRGDDGVVAGGAYRRLSDTDCELKRLYVTDGARGSGLGRKLSDALIKAAISDGYSTMQLDTGNRLTEAISMYESMGFKHIKPYQEYPAQLMPYLVFMQKPLN